LPDAPLMRAYGAKYPAVEENAANYLKRTFVEAAEADAQENGGWQDRARAEMRRLGVKTNAQFLFGVRYPAEWMVEMNGALLDTFLNAGFDCFRSHAGGEPEAESG
jgi:hypothetical protein